MVDTIAIYPNPVHKGLYISGIPNKFVSHVYVFTPHGELIIKKQIYKNEWIDVANLSNGTYIIYVVTRGRTFAKKIIKI